MERSSLTKRIPPFEGGENQEPDLAAKNREEPPICKVQYAQWYLASKF